MEVAVEFKFRSRCSRRVSDKEELVGIISEIRKEIYSSFRKYVRDMPRNLSSMWSGCVKVQIENHLANLPHRSKC